MPNAINATTPSVLMPYVLSLAFQQKREWTCDSNRYHDGSQQALAVVSSSRKRWAQTSKLKPADLQSLRNFYEAQVGGLYEFYFYDLYETSPMFSYDPSAASPSGLYVVCFEGGWQQSLGIARSTAQLALVEVS